MQHENILVLGGTGATGRLLVNEALDRGHRVTALVRPGRRLPRWEGLTVIEGDVLDEDVLTRAAQGNSAIVSCLGVSRVDPTNPLSRTLADPNFLERAARRIASVAFWTGIRRVLAISAAGVGDSYQQIDVPSRIYLSLSPFGQVADAGARMEAVLRSSHLDWKVARPVRLIDGPATGRATAIGASGLGHTLRRADLANWMLDALEWPAPFQVNAEMVGCA